MGSLGTLGRVAWRVVGGRRHLDVQPARTGAVIGIYRSHNTNCVRVIVEDLTQAGWAARLWALDKSTAELSAWTLGSGPGTRTQLLNRLASDDSEGPVLICDDDVSFPGGVKSFVGAAQQTGWDLVQPGITWDSEFSYPITASRPWLAARETTFVEIGPVLYADGPGRNVVFPMDEAFGMGWGLEIGWHDAITAGEVRAGVIDATPVRHNGTVGSAYAKEAEIDALRERLAIRGLSSLRDIARTRRRYVRLPS